MSYNTKANVGALVEMLSTGLPYSKMAERLGYADGHAMRQACLVRGLSRKICGDVVIVVANPT